MTDAEAPTRRYAGIAADVVGVALTLGTVVVSALNWYAPIGSYDEGILLTDANLILHGDLPYRDFYVNYPPGVFVVLAICFGIFGSSVAVSRAVGIVVHLGIALLAGRVAGRIAGRRHVWLASGLTMAYVRLFGSYPAAFVGGILLCLIVLLLVSAEHVDRRRLVLAGVALALVSFVRHDLFVYFAPALFALASAMGRARATWPLWATAAAVVAALWGPTFAVGGAQVLDDLYFDQVRFIMPARVLPFPPLFQWESKEQLATAAAVVACFAALPAVAVAWAVTRGRATQQALWGLLGLGALCAAVLPHMLGRTDLGHATQASVPAWILCAAGLDLFARNVRPAAFVVVPCALLLALPALRRASPVEPLEFHEQSFARSAGIRERRYDERRVALDFIRANTTHDDRVFIGLFRHDLLVINEMDMYFLADRRGATRIMQFDPGQVTRADVQRRMIDEISRRGANVAVLARAWYWPEPNASAEPGSTLLDEWLAQHFVVEGETPNYKLLRRR